MTTGFLWGEKTLKLAVGMAAQGGCTAALRWGPAWQAGYVPTNVQEQEGSEQSPGRERPGWGQARGGELQVGGCLWEMKGGAV